MPKVFISYSRNDLSSAQELEQVLHARGVEVWRDQHSLYGGDRWPKKLGEAIAACDAVLLLWSGQSSASHFAEFEWVTALALKKTTIPLLLDDTALPPALVASNGIPCQKLDEALPKILAVLQVAAGPKNAERQSRVIAQLEQVTAAEPAEALKQAQTLFSQSHLQVGGNFIQGGGNVTYNDSRLLIAALAVIAVISLAAFYLISLNGTLPPQPVPLPTPRTTMLSGTVVEPSGKPIQGALITVDDLPGMKSVETDIDGKFTLIDIPKSYGEAVKIRVIKEGYQPNPYTEGNIVLGKSPPRVKLTREKK